MNNFFCSLVLFQLDNVTVSWALRIKDGDGGMIKRMYWVNVDPHPTGLQNFRLQLSFFSDLTWGSAERFSEWRRLDRIKRAIHSSLGWLVPD